MPKKFLKLLDFFAPYDKIKVYTKKTGINIIRRTNFAYIERTDPMKKALLKIREYAKKSRGITLAAILGFAAITLALCFFAYSAAYAKILPNIEVEGIRIGGMTIDEAEKTLEDAFGEISIDREITLNCDKNQKTVDLIEFDLKSESKETVQKAFKVGRSGGIFKKTGKLFSLAFKGETVPLAVSMDEKLLEDVIKELAADKEIPAVSTYYEIDGSTLTIVRGHGGRMIDRKEVRESLRQAVLDSSIKELSFKIKEVPEEKADLDKLYEEIMAPMKNAEYSLKDGEVIIIPEKVGIKVDKESVKMALDANQPRYDLTVETEMPEVSSADLQELLFRDTMGTWSSNFATSTAERASNVILTASRIDGVILMPGDEFSYDKTVGRRTVENGYREAGVYIGNKVESGIGGGICQTSSTLYSAALYANLEIVSRTSHSLPVSYMPPGQDATIAEGYIDLKLKNNTPYPIKISAKVEGRRLTCSILGVKDPEITVELYHSRTATYEPETERTENPEIPKGYKYIANKGAIGYAIASSRVVKKNGEVIKTEKLTRSVYRAAPIEEEVNPLDKETPSENLKPYTPGMEISKEEPDIPTVNQDEQDSEQTENKHEEESTPATESEENSLIAPDADSEMAEENNISI